MQKLIPSRVLSGDFILGGGGGGNMVDNFKDSKKGHNIPVGAFAIYKPALAFNTHIMYLSNTTRLNNTWSVIKNRAIP